MNFKHYLVRLLEYTYLLVSFTGIFKTSIGKKIYQYLYEKYKLKSEGGALLLLSKYIKVGSLVIDVGANIGIYSEVFSNAVGSNGKVIAIEPDPSNLQTLSKKFSSSESNVEIVNAAVSNKIGTLYLKQNASNPAGHYISDQGVAVKGITIDHITLDSKIPLSLIKIDVEGAEGLVIDGGKKTIIKHRPVIHMEYSPERLINFGSDPIDLLSFLEKNKYSFCLLDKKNEEKIFSLKEIYNYSKSKIVIDLICLPNMVDGK